MTESCESRRYMIWLYIFVIPAIIFFALILPLFAFMYMYKNKHILGEKEIMKKVGFIGNGLKHKEYYWYLYLFNDVSI